MTRPTLRTYRSPEEEARHDAALRNLLAALDDLKRKVATHDAAGWSENGRSSIQIGAVRPVMAALAAYRGGEA